LTLKLNGNCLIRENSKFWLQDILELADLKETKFWHLSLDNNTCQATKY